jgi:predicted kinase
MTDRHVVLTGPSASGKTFVAVAIGRSLPAVVLSKDLIKEALADPLGITTDEESLKLSGSAMALLHSLAAASGIGVVMEANWKSHIDVPKLEALALPIVQILCDAPTDVLVARMRARIASGARHRVHRDVMSARVFDSMVNAIDRQREPLPVTGPILHLDTSTPTDINAVVDWITSQTLS